MSDKTLAIESEDRVNDWIEAHPEDGGEEWCVFLSTLPGYDQEKDSNECVIPFADGSVLRTVDIFYFAE